MPRVSTAYPNPRHRKTPGTARTPANWIDLDKIIRADQAAGELAPYGYTQIGPDLFHPGPGSQMRPLPEPPDPAEHPLDVADLVIRSPRELGPYG